MIKYPERTEHLKSSTRKRRTSHYNCAGYALNTFNWYNPMTEEMWQRAEASRDFLASLFVNPISFIEEMENMIEILLKDFSDLRRIKDVSECSENEYVIAMRCAEDDFHFMKRDKRGCWWEKMGRCGIRKVKKENVFTTGLWNWRYSSEIVLFAKQTSPCN